MIQTRDGWRRDVGDLKQALAQVMLSPDLEDLLLPLQILSEMWDRERNSKMIVTHQCHFNTQKHHSVIRVMVISTVSTLVNLFAN